MTVPLLNERDLNFQLYEVLDTEALLKRPRYRDHSREIFDSTLSTARGIAEKYFANHYSKGDANEPFFDGGEVHVIPETKVAWDAFADAGFMAAQPDYEDGGLQFPEVIVRAVVAYISAANIGTAAYPFVAIGVANLLRAFGSKEQKEQFLPLIMSGKSNGTMALTEPDQGSALGDIKTSAVPHADGSYRLYGQKMFISCADHNITDNIVHMVLAKIKDAPVGVKGISLFIVPKYLIDEQGNPRAKNDVVVAGLNHKMGYRNATNTVLSFGEKDGAVGYLVGQAHQGLNYMFQMMNEARIGIGLGAAALAYQGYNHSLAYARQRPQGRLPSNKNPESAQIMLVEHADVRRLLLAQKAYAEGSLSLCLFASALFEDQNTAQNDAQRERAALLLDLLTPIVKSWPSKYGCVANDMAIQVLGGSGYIREYPVEQLYRDQRLNPIHEGAEAIHGLDLLGRKVPMKNMAGYQVFMEELEKDIAQAESLVTAREFVEPLRCAKIVLDATTQSLLAQTRVDIDRGMANATIYLDMFGRVVAAWMWVKQAIKAEQGLASATVRQDIDFYNGKIHAARYFIQWELPLIDPQRELLCAGNPVCYDMQDAWF